MSEQPPSSGSGRPWLVLIAMTGGLSMVMLDQTIVTVALPTMMRDIPLSPGGTHWVVSAYVLAMAALVALGAASATARLPIAAAFALSAAVLAPTLLAAFMLLSRQRLAALAADGSAG